MMAPLPPFPRLPYGTIVRARLSLSDFSQQDTRDTNTRVTCYVDLIPSYLYLMACDSYYPSYGEWLRILILFRKNS